MNNLNLFVYGTLMFPEIQEALLQRRLKSQEAILKDFSANSIVYGQYYSEYPFLKPAKGEVVEGRLVYDLTGWELNLIKFYKGSEFTLSNVNVIVNSKEVEVQTFMIKKKDKVLYGPLWNEDIFIREYLDSYLTVLIPQVLINYNM